MKYIKFTRAPPRARARAQVLSSLARSLVTASRFGRLALLGLLGRHTPGEVGLLLVLLGEDAKELLLATGVLEQGIIDPAQLLRRVVGVKLLQA